VVLDLIGGPALAVKRPEEEAEHVKGRHPRRHGGKEPDQEVPLRELKAFQRISSLLKNPENPGMPAIARQAMKKVQ